MSLNTFSYLLNQYQIVAVDDYNQIPHWIYIAPSGNQVTELTKVICIDLDRQVVFAPQMIGSYAKFMTPIRLIDPNLDNIEEIQKRIEELPDLTKINLSRIMEEKPEIRDEGSHSGSINENINNLNTNKTETMEAVKFENAYYIKLGAKGIWAEESINNGIVRIGWGKVSLENILNGNWDDIRNVIKKYYDERGKKTGTTQDYEALKRFCDATANDVFITFYKGIMYWCNLDNSPMEMDLISKFRRTINGWSCKSLNDSAKELSSNDISGRISKTQAFQGTLCRYKDTEKDNEVEIINRIINGYQNPNVEEIKKFKYEICRLTIELLQHLHWKDCEILSDLIFIQSGWRRVSMQGGSMEFTDMEYFDPINNEKYAVQIKSGASKKDFEKYEKDFSNRGFRKLFFVVFNPENSLDKVKNERRDIEILSGDKLATLIFDLGLLEWVLKKSF